MVAIERVGVHRSTVGLPGAAVAWCALVAGAVVWGRHAVAPGLGLGAPPLVGTWDPHVRPRLLVAAVVAAAVVLTGPRLAARLPWRAVPPVSGAAAIALAVSVAAADGWHRLTEPLTSRYEYEPFAATITSATAFVRGFVESVPDLPTHVKGHPPLATLVPWGLDRVGLGGTGWFAATVVVAWGVAVAAALVAARAVSGEAVARRAAPALVLVPAVLWAATSADALFAGVGAAGVALAVRRPGDRRATLAGGLVLGVALLLSYGAALLLVLPAAVALRRRSLDDLIVTGAGVLVVLAAAAAAGFWWLDGLAATRAEYWDGVAGRRPLGYLTLAGNPAALALACGPAVAAGLVRHARRAPLVLGGLGAVVAADASMLSAGEVERIWLPFVPWLALAAPGDDRRWLAAQAATVLALAVVLRSPW